MLEYYKSHLLWLSYSQWRKAQLNGCEDALECLGDLEWFASTNKDLTGFHDTHDSAIVRGEPHGCVRRLDSSRHR